MESLGIRIKNLRLAKGLTLEEAHKQTKIHLNILKAIEEDNLINLDPIYVKGFLKIYCKFLGVEPGDYIPESKEKEKAESKAAAALYGPEPVENPESALKKFSLKLPPVKLPAIKLPLKQIITAALAVALIFALFQFGKFISQQIKRVPKKSAPAAEAVVKKVPVPPSSPKIKKHPAAPIPAQSSTSGIRLSILTKEDCWINLKSDGKLAFRGILKKGRTESWQADDRIELSLGNAGVVNLEVNGKLITNLGRKGQSLKNIVITKEGLNIGK
jgi:cytoskeleton protein RodZ